MSPSLFQPIVLASASAARARLLAAAGITTTVEPSAIDEAEIKQSFRCDSPDPAACATALAEAKARRVAANHPGALVIGADQILDCGGIWFDKPRDRAEAREQLQHLRGREHILISAVAVLAEGAIVWHQVERARLTMRAFSDAFLDDYLATVGDEVCRLVGGYALEGFGAQLFAAVEGDYFSILGLPLLPLLDFLRARGALAR